MPDIGQIREQLNELPFKDGKREICVGRISELFEGASQADLAQRLRQFENKLQSHALKLSRGAEDRDALFVTQQLRTLPRDLSWMADAMRWVSKITTVAVEMVLPGLAGYWLDLQLQTSFLMPLGFAFGAPLAIWTLIAMTKSKRKDASKSNSAA